MAPWPESLPLALITSLPALDLSGAVQEGFEPSEGTGPMALPGGSECSLEAAMGASLRQISGCDREAEASKNRERMFLIKI